MKTIRKFLTGLASFIGAVFLVAIGTVVFLFGGIIGTAIMIAAGIGFIIMLVAYGIYELINNPHKKEKGP